MFSRNRLDPVEVHRLLSEGKSQAEIGRLLGFTRQAVSRLLKNRAQPGFVGSSASRTDGRELVEEAPQSLNLIQNRLDPDEVNRLLSEGKSQAEIGRILGFTRQAVSRLLKNRAQSADEPVEEALSDGRADGREPVEPVEEALVLPLAMNTEAASARDASGVASTVQWVSQPAAVAKRRDDGGGIALASARARESATSGGSNRRSMDGTGNGNGTGTAAAAGGALRDKGWPERSTSPSSQPSSVGQQQQQQQQQQTDGPAAGIAQRRAHCEAEVIRVEREMEQVRDGSHPEVLRRLEVLARQRTKELLLAARMRILRAQSVATIFRAECQCIEDDYAAGISAVQADVASVLQASLNSIYRMQRRRASARQAIRQSEGGQSLVTGAVARGAAGADAETTTERDASTRGRLVAKHAIVLSREEIYGDLGKMRRVVSKRDKETRSMENLRAEMGVPEGNSSEEDELIQDFMVPTEAKRSSKKRGSSGGASRARSRKKRTKKRSRR